MPSEPVETAYDVFGNIEVDFCIKEANIPACDAIEDLYGVRYDGIMPNMDIDTPSTQQPSCTANGLHYLSIDRSSFTSRDVVEEVWKGLGLPTDALESLKLPGDGKHTLPSSYKVGIMA